MRGRSIGRDGCLAHGVPREAHLDLPCVRRLYLDFLRFGTLAPFFRASERPIAIACFLLFTFPARPPGPERNVPRFRRRIALSTRLDAAAPYRRPERRRRVRFVVAMSTSWSCPI
jgi:hypothetical protein